MIISSCNQIKQEKIEMTAKKIVREKSVSKVAIEKTKKVKPFEIKPFSLKNKEFNEAEIFLLKKGIKENTVNEFDQYNVLQQTISDSLFNILQLLKIKPTENSNQKCLIKASVPFSNKYYSYIISFSDPDVWHELYLVNYDTLGNMVDFLIIEQEDYIESYTYLKSNILKNKITRTMYSADFDKSPSTYNIWKTDEFTLDNIGGFQGENIIFKERI